MNANTIKETEVHELFIRNLGTLSAESQLAISNTKIGMAGCGMGSEVARQLTRFGFQIAALADPDTVEIHNLNRQSYHHQHVGKRKAEALREKIQLINPAQDPKLYLEGITHENYVQFVEGADIIIDGIDPTYMHMSILLTREARRQGKPVVTAIDFGFGARLFVFMPDGPDILEFMGLDSHTTDEAIKNMPIEKLMVPYMKDIPDYALQIILSTVNGELNFYPQNVLAVTQAATMITAACKRIVLKQPLVTIPSYVHIDVDNMLQEMASIK